MLKILFITFKIDQGTFQSLFIWKKITKVKKKKKIKNFSAMKSVSIFIKNKTKKQKTKQKTRKHKLNIFNKYNQYWVLN